MTSFVGVVTTSPATLAVSEPQTSIITDAYNSDPPDGIDAEHAPVFKTPPKPKGKMYVKVDRPIKIFSDSKTTSPVIAKEEDVVKVTGKKKNGLTEIIHNDTTRWVETPLITSTSPPPPINTEPCSNVSEAGITPNLVKVIRAVCGRFPDVRSYGTLRPGAGDHSDGRAVDIMVDPSSELGTQISDFLQPNQAELGIDYLIWRQRIWRPATSPDWRHMEDRGDPTANHFDHVHVSVS